MRGANELVAARLNGQYIRMVAVSMNGAPPDKEESHVDSECFGFITITPRDAIAGLDLRVVAGLPVVLVGDDPRWLECIDRLTTFAPTSIAAHNGEYAVRWNPKTGLEDWNE